MLEWLKTILGDAYTEDVDKKVAGEIGKNFVAKSDFNATNEAKKQLETSLKERDNQLETLKNSTGDIEGLKKQIETLQTENKTKDATHATEIKQLKVDSAITAALTSAKAVNVKAVKALLDLGELEKVELQEDGSIKGLSDKIAALQKADDSKMLFAANAKTIFKGMAPGETGKEGPDTITLEKFLALSSSDQVKFKEENENWKEILNI